MLRLLRWPPVLLLPLFCLSVVSASPLSESPEPPVASSSEDRPDAKLDLALAAGLKELINRGVDLYNGGEIASCYRLYEGALRAIKPLLRHRPELPKIINEKLAEAEKESVTWRKAFALRAALDKVRSELIKPLPDDKEAEKKKLAQEKALAEAQAEAKRRAEEEAAKLRAEVEKKHAEEKKNPELEQKRAEEKKQPDEKKNPGDNKPGDNKKPDDKKPSQPDDKKPANDKKPADDNGGLQPPPLPGPPLPVPDLPLPGLIPPTSSKNGLTLIRSFPTELPPIEDD
jgi:hypothetical protein